MASIVLTAAVASATATAGATAIGTALALGAAGALGGFIDNSFLFLLFGKDQRPEQLVGPRIADFQIQTASEGTRLPFIQGPLNRIAGNIIWMSPLKEEKLTTTTEIGGGKGGGGSEVTQTSFKNFVSVAVALGEGVINDIVKIWADGILLFEKNRQNTVTDSTVLSVEVRKFFEIAFFGGFVAKKLVRIENRINSPIGGPDLAEFESGKDVIISGFTKPENNGTFRIIRSGTNTDSSTFCDIKIAQNLVTFDTALITNRAVRSQDVNPDRIVLLFLPGTGVQLILNPLDFGFQDGMMVFIGGVGGNQENHQPINAGTFLIDTVTSTAIIMDAAVTFIDVVKEPGVVLTGFFGTDEAAGASVTMIQDKDDFISKDMTGFTVHFGTDSQAADTLIESFEGVGEVPGYVGIAYVVLEDINLDRFGKRVPQLSFLVEKEVSINVGSAIAERLDRSGLTSVDYDVSAIVDNLQGFTTVGPQTTSKQITPLLTAFNVNVTESNGKLVFKKRDAATIIDIVDDDLAAHISGRDIQRRIIFTKGDLIGVPKEVNVNYIDAASDFQTGSQKQRKIEHVVDSTVTFELPITMPADDARNIAFRELWTAHSNNDIIALSLPPTYFFLEENDTIRFKGDADEQFIAVIKKTDRGLNFLMLFDTLVESSTTLEHDASEDDPFILVDPTIYVPPEMRLEILDIPPLIDDHIDVIGYYTALAAEQPGGEFQGAVLFSSLAPAPFENVSNYSIEAVMGNVSGIIAVGETEIFDEATVITVVLIEGALESKTELEVLNGQNRGIFGGEIIGFKNAVLIAPNTYELSGLIRGIKNTEYFIPVHVDGERFVLLSGVGIQFISIDIDQLTFTKEYRPVPTGGELNTTIGIQRQLFGKTIRPFFPAHVEGKRDVNNNLTITWIRRSRAIFNIFNVEAPLIEAIEEYEVHILDSANEIILRVIPVVGISEAVYTATEQIEDGFIPGDDIDLIVYQISSTTGRLLINEPEIAFELVKNTI